MVYGLVGGREAHVELPHTKLYSDEHVLDWARDECAALQVSLIRVIKRTEEVFHVRPSI